MEIDLESDLEALREKLSAAIADDVRQTTTIQARIDKNKALLGHIKASLSAYRPNANKPGANGQETTTVKGRVLAAIESLTKTTFTGNDVLDEINTLFPGNTVTRPAISSMLWKLSERDKVEAFVQISAGRGRAQARYEKRDGGTGIQQHREIA